MSDSLTPAPAKMLLFRAIDGVLVDRGEWDRAASPRVLPYAWALVPAMGRYLPAMRIVLASDGAPRHSAATVKAATPQDVACQVAGDPWDAIPPRPLGLYGQHPVLAGPRVRWLSARLAGRRTRTADWPSNDADRLVQCEEPLGSPVTQERLRDRLSHFGWPDLWWGGGRRLMLRIFDVPMPCS